MKPESLLILGANGQLGRALQAKYPEAQAVDSSTLDITDAKAVAAFDWPKVSVILNAAGYTNVDGAETAEGRVSAWKVNVTGMRNVVDAAVKNNLTLFHVSTDYVFDGSVELHAEDEPFSPLGVYAQTKAAGDVIASLTPQLYLLRVSWVIGDGKNFVRSIMSLADRDISPNVVADQFGRLTFTTEIVRVIDHFLQTKPAYGTYNVSNSGDIVSWADIARQIYADLKRDDLHVGDTTAEEYFAGKVSSPRPVHSGLKLDKLEATGFKPTDWRDDLAEYIKAEIKKELS